MAEQKKLRVKINQINSIYQTPTPRWLSASTANPEIHAHVTPRRRRPAAGHCISRGAAFCEIPLQGARRVVGDKRTVGALNTVRY